MIYEFRTYTFPPGKIGAYLDLAGNVGLPIRKNDFGTNHGYWSADIGALNQAWHLWSYKDLNERAEFRARLSRDPRWTNDYVAKVGQLIARQDIRLMHPLIEPRVPAELGNLYELRIYRTQVGQARRWASMIQEYLPAREKYSKIVALWHTEAGQPNEVVHLWAYKDLNARAKARADAIKDPAWQEFLGKSSPLLVEMHSTILVPASFSPLR
ncbi:MAG TPA: NIPSNAP family protein [Candidatus Cybelea sp.]|nr:NIPSNAP family protein [Candidatus Cybelea sp.]